MLLSDGIEGERPDHKIEGRPGGGYRVGADALPSHPRQVGHGGNQTLALLRRRMPPAGVSAWSSVFQWIKPRRGSREGIGVTVATHSRDASG